MRLLSGTGVLRNNKKKMLVAVMALLLTLPVSACEICGCSINGYNFGILPQFRKNIVGLRHTYRSFHSQHLISEQLFILGHQSQERYHTTELWGRFYVGKKLQLFAFVPYNHFRTEEAGVVTHSQGLGDITLAANYKLYDNVANGGPGFKHTLLAGGGIKLPTGKFSTAKMGQQLNPSINSGTGSVDYLANLIYNCRINKWGLNAEFNYRINGKNADDFQFGNRYTTAARFFYWQNIGKKTTVLPNAGLLFEQAGQDRHNGEVQTYSGGHITYLTTGAEMYMGKINVGFTYSHPLGQHLFKGLVTNNNQFAVNMSFLF